MNLKLINLRENPSLSEKAAEWFASVWNIPIEEYKQSIECSVITSEKIPRWYVLLNENHEIIAGTGVIENGFHQRKDLSPNVCALFMNPAYRKNGIAKYILDKISEDMKKSGYTKLYLITDNDSFYEKYGWEFFGMILTDENEESRMYCKKL